MKYLVWKKGLGRGGEGESFIFFCYFVLSHHPEMLFIKLERLLTQVTGSHSGTGFSNWTDFVQFYINSWSDLLSPGVYKVSKITNSSKVNYLKLPSQSWFYSESSGRHFQGQLMWFRLHYFGLGLRHYCLWQVAWVILVCVLGWDLFL